MIAFSANWQLIANSIMLRSKYVMTWHYCASTITIHELGQVTGTSRGCAHGFLVKGYVQNRVLLLYVIILDVNGLPCVHTVKAPGVCPRTRAYTQLIYNYNTSRTCNLYICYGSVRYKPVGCIYYNCMQFNGINQRNQERRFKPEFMEFFNGVFANVVSTLNTVNF